MLFVHLQICAIKLKPSSEKLFLLSCLLLPLAKGTCFPEKALPKIHKCNPADKLQLFIKMITEMQEWKEKKNNHTKEEKHTFFVHL